MHQFTVPPATPIIYESHSIQLSSTGFQYTPQLSNSILSKTVQSSSKHSTTINSKSIDQLNDSALNNTQVDKKKVVAKSRTQLFCKSTYMKYRNKEIEEFVRRAQSTNTKLKSHVFPDTTGNSLAIDIIILAPH